MEPPRLRVFGYDAIVVVTFVVFLGANFGMNFLLAWAMKSRASGGAGYSFPFFQTSTDSVRPPQQSQPPDPTQLTHTHKRTAPLFPSSQTSTDSVNPNPTPNPCSSSRRAQTRRAGVCGLGVAAC